MACSGSRWGALMNVGILISSGPLVFGRKNELVVPFIISLSRLTEKGYWIGIGSIRSLSITLKFKGILCPMLFLRFTNEGSSRYLRLIDFNLSDEFFVAGKNQVT